MQIDHIAPVFHVSDIDRSVAFYETVLGFTRDFRFGTYVGLEMDQFRLHLSQSDGSGRPVGGGTIYVFCDDVDAYYAQHIAGKDVNVIQPPADQAYGMRDFVFKDPDGNQLSFGRETGRVASISRC